MTRKKPETLEEYDEMIQMELEENERIRKNYYDALENLFHFQKICDFLNRLFERRNP